MEDYKCVRCGKLYEKKSLGLNEDKPLKDFFDIRVDIYEGYSGSNGWHEEIDLCTECKKELVKFLNLEKKY